MYIFIVICFSLFAMACPEGGKKHTNPDGSAGGIVGKNAKVSSDVFIAPAAKVCDFAKIWSKTEIRDEAFIGGHTEIGPFVIVKNKAQIRGQAKVSGLPELKTEVTGNALIEGESIISQGSKISDQVHITDSPEIIRTKVSGSSRVCRFFKIENDDINNADLYCPDPVVNLKYLKSIPEINDETKQWFIPFQNGSWGGWKSYTLKEYLVYPLRFDEKTNSYRIELHENKYLTGKKLIIQEGGRDKYRNQRTMRFSDGRVCQYMPESRFVMTKNWIDCANHKCIENTSKVSQEVLLRNDKTQSWYEYSETKTTDTKKKCKSTNGGFEDTVGDTYNASSEVPISGKYRTYTFIPKAIHSKEKEYGKIAEIDFGGKSYFLDLGNEYELYIGKKKKKLSNYETDWLLLNEKYEYVKKKIDKFFHRLKKEGVKLEFVTDGNESDFEFEISALYFEKKPKELTDDFVKEVKACVQNMRVTGMNTRSLFFMGDKKICAIWFENLDAGPRIKWVDYPEAFMKYTSVVRLP